MRNKLSGALFVGKLTSCLTPDSRVVGIRDAMSLDVTFFKWQLAGQKLGSI